MNKNTLANNLVIYKINPYHLLVLSINLGWILLPLHSYNNLKFENILWGYTKLYKFFFKLKGFGYKWKYNLKNDILNRNIFFKLGFTHRITLLLGINTKYKLKKKRFVIKSRSLKYLRENINFIYFLYKKYLYNKKGIYLRGTKFRVKISKKKSKF